MSAQVKRKKKNVENIAVKTAAFVKRRRIRCEGVIKAFASLFPE